jgi:hypothetical protein
MSSTSNALQAASDALKHAENKFPESMAAAAGVTPAKDRMKAPAKAPIEKKTSAPATTPAGYPEGNIGKELAEKSANVKQLANAPKYHKGGKIKKDGVQVVDAEKGETVLPKNNKKRATELAMKHLEGMKAGLKAAEKHSEKSEHKKAEHGKRHGKVKKMHVHVNDDNTFSMTHEHHPMEDGTPVADTTHSAPDMDGLIDHMQEHLGTPNPGEAEAEAGPAGASPAPAGA